MINRIIQENIKTKLFQNKAILLFGPRQTGKTTLLREIMKAYNHVLWLSGDEPDIRERFSSINSTELKYLIGENKYLIIDEAQRIDNIGLTLKLITDHIPSVQVIATGSSAFNLKNNTNEPLTGRKFEYQLFPLSYAELCKHYGVIEEQRMLSRRLIFGSYPEVINNPGNEKEVLFQLSDSYLYKDLLTYDGIKKPEYLFKLLKALALQVGNEVSYNEIGQLIGLDNQVVEKYINLLEKSYVIFRLGALKRNLRNELKKGKKIYFVDNGILNAVNAQFASIDKRNDIGVLWENYLISERNKKINYDKLWSNQYFWRTHEQKEIDYIEEKNGVLHSYEFKWNSKTNPKIPKSFANAYPNHTYKIINKTNYNEFLR